MLAINPLLTHLFGMDIHWSRSQRRSVLDSTWLDFLADLMFSGLIYFKSFMWPKVSGPINYGTIWILIVSKLRIANVLRTLMFWCQPGPGVVPFSFTELSSWPKLLPGDTGAGPFQWGIPPNDGSQGQNMRKCSNELDDLGNPHFRKAPNRYSKREIMRNSGVQDDLGGAIIFLFETKPYRHFLLLLGLQFGWQNVGSSEACHHWDQVMGLYENWRNPNSNGLKPYFISSEQFLISSCWGISKSICLSYIFGTVSHRCQVSSMDSRPRSPRSMPCWTGAWNMQRWSSSAVAALVDEAESAPGIRWNFGWVA